jgi:hypothetical protein
MHKIGQASHERLVDQVLWGGRAAGAIFLLIDG